MANKVYGVFISPIATGKDAAFAKPLVCFREESAIPATAAAGFSSVFVAAEVAIHGTNSALRGVEFQFIQATEQAGPALMFHGQGPFTSRTQ
jgi:hypothetical protein